MLGTFWVGVGAVIGELAAPYLRRWRVWPTMTGIVLGWGLALVPLGLVLQDASPPAALAQVIAARSSLLILASPVGITLGGPIMAVLGARGTLLASALATVALVLITAAILAARRSSGGNSRPPARATTLSSPSHTVDRGRSRRDAAAM